METKRLRYLDIAKGIGIILVLYSHSCGFPRWGEAVNAFFMAMFFFVSGYLYSGKRSAKENIIKKMKSLLIPYVGYTMLLYAEHIVIGLLKHEINKEYVIMPLIGALYSRGALYADMTRDNIYFLLISNGPLWFIPAMALSSVFFYLLVKAFLEDKKKMYIIATSLVALTIVFSYCPLLLPWSIDTMPALVLIMLLGAKLRNIEYFDKQKVTVSHVITVVSAAVFYCILCERMGMINLSIRDYGYPGIKGAIWYLFAAITGTLIFVKLCRIIEKYRFTNVLVSIGKHTYSIMALHIILVKYLNKAYYVFHMTFEFNKTNVFYWIYWTTIFATIIVICVAFDKILMMVKNCISNLRFAKKIAKE